MPKASQQIPKTHTLRIMSAKGDETLTWTEGDTLSQTEVDRRFQELVGSHAIFDVTDPRHPKAAIAFDPTADLMATRPAVAG